MRIYYHLDDSIKSVIEFDENKTLLEAFRSVHPDPSAAKIPKLHDSRGFLIPIGPNTPQNTENTSYILSYQDGLILPF